MTDQTTQWVIPITQNLIAALIAWACAKFISSKRESITMVAGVASKATKTMAPAVLKAVALILIYWFLLSQIRAFTMSTEPLTRSEIAGVAGWISITLIFAIRQAFGRND